MRGWSELPAAVAEDQAAGPEGGSVDENTGRGETAAD